MPSKRLFIIIMATKSLSKIHASSFRAPHSHPHRTRMLDPPSQASPCGLESSSSELHQLSSAHNDEQLRPKMQKESTSPLNNNALPIIPITDKLRPLTRSTTTSSNPFPLDADQLNDHLTPEQQPHQRPFDDLRCKRLSKASSWQEFSDSQCDLNMVTKRSCSKITDTMVSPYSEVRKSYRKMSKKEILSVPYRKCHDAMEGRIVTVINKITNGKNCAKDFENLVDKMAKISAKDMANRYVIAGIRTIISMTEEGNQLGIKLSFMEGRAILRLKEEECKLQLKLADELDNFQRYESQLVCDEEFNGSEYRSQIMRRMYSLMKERWPERERLEMRRKVMMDCEVLFSGQLTLSQLVKHMRERIAK